MNPQNWFSLPRCLGQQRHCADSGLPRRGRHIQRAAVADRRARRVHKLRWPKLCRACWKHEEFAISSGRRHRIGGLADFTCHAPVGNIRTCELLTLRNGLIFPAKYSSTPARSWRHNGARHDTVAAGAHCRRGGNGSGAGTWCHVSRIAAKPHSAAEAGVVAAMWSVAFPDGRRASQLWRMYFGYGLWQAVCLFEAASLWFIAPLAKTTPAHSAAWCR